MQINYFHVSIWSILRPLAITLKTNKVNVFYNKQDTFLLLYNLKPKVIRLNLMEFKITLVLVQ